MTEVITKPPASYRRVLRDRRLAGLLAGDVLSGIGDGMSFVALPLIALRLHGPVDPALAVSLVILAPYLLSTALSLLFGLGRRRFDPRRIMLADAALRTVAFTGLGVLALTGTLRLWSLVAALFAGSVLRLLSASSRRLVVTDLAGDHHRLAANGLLSVCDNLSVYVAGPAMGGLLVTVADPAVVLLVDGLSFVALLIAVALAVPATRPLGPMEGPGRPVVHRREPGGDPAPVASGWTILRRTPVAWRLFLVVFLFYLFYGPVEIALPLLLTGPPHTDEGALGTVWTAFGAGALGGALLTNRLRQVPERTLLVGIIGGWAASVGLLAGASTVTVAATALGLGGLVYGPFVAVAYTLLQDTLTVAEQQPVFTLWSASLTAAAPIGLGLAGPLVTVAGPRGGLLTSAVITALLVPLAARWLRVRPVPAPPPETATT